MISKWNLNIWRREGGVGKLLFIEHSTVVLVKSLELERILGLNSDSAT